MKKSVKKKKSTQIAHKLQKWFRRASRDLPWRINSDPYRIWLSEIMLQQTQVVTVIPYFNRFMDRFPTVGDLARADLETVYALWSGLGYYSRARNLHRGAQVIAKRLNENKGFPQNRQEWLEVPGVGPYTAGAICSIAMDQPEPLVDGNVVRVLSRLFSVSKLDSKKSEIWVLAGEIVTTPRVSPRIVNQALMELGALICRPKNPDCDLCPLHEECEGKLKPERYPPPKPPKQWKTIQEERWVLVFGTKVLLVQDSEQRWRKGLWDFPSAEDVRVHHAKLLGEKTLRYVITQHKILRMHKIYKVTRQQVKVRVENFQWSEIHELPGVPAPVRKFLKMIAPAP